MLTLHIWLLYLSMQMTDHWVTIKVISDHEVYIYDSLFLKPTHTLKQIAAIIQTKSPKIQLHLERVQM